MNVISECKQLANYVLGFFLCKRIGFVDNLTMKHCDKTKVKTITVIKL